MFALHTPFEATVPPKGPSIALQDADPLTRTSCIIAQGLLHMRTVRTMSSSLPWGSGYARCAQGCAQGLSLGCRDWGLQPPGLIPHALLSIASPWVNRKLGEDSGTPHSIQRIYQ